MKTLRKITLPIFVVLLLIYSVQRISYAQDETPKAPTLTPGETNTSLIVRFSADCDNTDKAYQVQLRRKSPQGEWTTKCLIVKKVSIGGGIRSWFGIPIGTWSSTTYCTGNVWIIGDLEAGVTYEARYRDAHTSECVENPPVPGPWSMIGEGTTHLVAPPRVEFIDANLARAVRRELDLYTSGEHIELLKIPEAALAELTSLNHVNYRILKLTGLDLSGLEQATQLTDGAFELLKISVEELAKLKLAGLNDRDYQITNLSGLEQATQLRELDLSGNDGISDYNSLSGLTNLTELYLYENQIKDITPLSGLTNLAKLHLFKNRITDITPLSGLTNLTELYLYENQITDISPLVHLTQLTKLDLSNNQIKDVTPLTNLIFLEELLLKGNTIEDTAPLNALLDENPDMDLDIAHALIREEGGTTITASTRQPLTWITLNESGVKLTLSSGTFHTDEKQIADAITIFGIPDISISKWNWYDDFEVERYRSGTEIQFRLTYEGSHTITTDATLTITVEPEAIAYYNGPPLTSEIPVTVPTEADLTEISQALKVSTSAPLTGSTLGGNIVTLKLHSKTFDFSFPSRWVYTLIDGLTVSGIPGIGLDDEYEDYGVEYVSSTEVKFKFTYEGDLITTDSVLTLTVDPKAVVGYNGDPYTLEIPVTGVTKNELSQTLTASTAYPLTAVTLHGSIVTLKLTDAVFEARVWNYIKISGIPAVTKSGRKVSDTEIKYELSFFDNIDTDATLTFTVQPDGIMGYNGPPLTAEIPVSASTEIEHTGELVASTPIPLTKTTLNKNYVRLTLQNNSYKTSDDYDYDDGQVIQVISIPNVGTKTGGFGSGEYAVRLSSTDILVNIVFSDDFNTDATLIFTVPPSLIENYDGPPLTASLPVSAATGPQALVPESHLPLMYWINTDTDKIESVAPFEAVTQGVVSITVDAASGKIYWSEKGSSDSTIKRANLDGTAVENLATLSTTPHYLFVDSANNRLYWADTLQNSIQSADLNGKNINTLIQEVGDDITSMALDVEGDKLYWGDAQYRIHCMNLDGTNVERLLTEGGTGWNPWIGSIAIVKGKIYWIEGISWYLRNGKVHRANLDGTNVETLTHQLGSLISIAVDTGANMVYWTNSLGGIQQMDLSTGEVKAVVSGITSPGNLVLVPGTQQITTDTTVSIPPASVASPVI